MQNYPYSYVSQNKFKRERSFVFFTVANNGRLSNRISLNFCVDLTYVMLGEINDTIGSVGQILEVRWKMWQIF